MNLIPSPFRSQKHTPSGLSYSGEKKAVDCRPLDAWPESAEILDKDKASVISDTSVEEYCNLQKAAWKTTPPFAVFRVWRYF
ncbi:MAG: hypothetical protein UGF45_13220 [Massilioclostridium sp.]|nr:hypothetical protein [Massilioclostridium sp.]MEE1492927.1 hypothetical protein [Massilioclostridium sp.]